jgi:hypothetical protein
MCLVRYAINNGQGTFPDKTSGKTQAGSKVSPADNTGGCHRPTRLKKSFNSN